MSKTLENELKTVKAVPNKIKFSNDYFPLHGVSLQFLLKHFKGVSTFNSMYDVGDYVLKLTERFKCSFLELVREKKEFSTAVYDHADHFVSFAYKISLSELLSALEKHMISTQKNDLVVWISIFSVNQHYNTDPGYPSGWFNNTFGKAIPKIGSTLFVMSPWKSSIALSRLWCIFELYITLKAENGQKCELHICLGEDDEKSFVLELLQDLGKLVEHVSNIKSENATAQYEKDVNEIRGYVSQLPNGFETVNDEIRERLRKWFATTAERQLQTNKTFLHKKENLPKLANLLNASGRLFHEQGAFEKAEEYLRENVRVRAECFGKTHVEYAAGLNNLAQLLSDQGKFKEAEQLLREALKIDEKVYGKIHYVVALRLNNLSGLLNEMGKIEEAIKVVEQAISVGKETLGPKHPTVATMLSNLATMLLDQGNLNKAESLFTEVLEINKQKLGTENPTYATDLDNLGTLRKEQGKYELAEALYRQSLELRRKLLGNEHPSVAESLNNLAASIQNQGKYEDAEVLFRQALEMKQKQYGVDHPSVALALNNLAGVLIEMGQKETALEMYYGARKIKEKAYGTQHPSYVSQLNNIAMLLSKMGRVEEALKLQYEAIEINRKTREADNLDLAHYLNNLGKLLILRGDASKAETSLNEALEIRKKLLGEMHSKVADTYRNLAEALRNQKGQEKRAQKLWMTALSIYENTLGKDHPTYKVCKSWWS